MTQQPQDGDDFFAPLPSSARPPVVSGPRDSNGLAVPARVGNPSHLQPATSRWAKSDTTFGPAGRIVTTILLILPLVFFVVTGVLTFDPFVFIGAAIWAALMWTGLRHVWTSVKRR